MNQLRSEAEELRGRGYSYGMIHDKLGISKSTMSYWFKDKPFVPNFEVMDRVKQGPLKVGIRRHNQRVTDIARAKEAGIKEIGLLSKRDLWMLGLGLYIGEGSKSIENVRIMNSNPAVILIAIRWLKEVCGLSNDNIVISLHLYPDNDISEALGYWSHITGLPGTNFRKTQIDIRQDKKASKRGKLPYGTAHLRVIGNGDPTKGVVLFRRIDGWMTGALSQSSPS